MTLTERCKTLKTIFFLLENTTSRIEKQAIIDIDVSDELRDDFNCCIEVLNGKYVFGYKYCTVISYNKLSMSENNTVRSIIEFLCEPRRNRNLSEANIKTHLEMTQEWAWFFEPLVNKELKLGIGRSLLEKENTSPMLAKTYKGNAKFSRSGYYITEKLDGNRCISYFDGEKWRFKSRNGKDMYVDFDMTGLPTDQIYDGEVLSREQVEMSLAISNRKIWTGYTSFNSTSGMINNHDLSKKELYYNIFDVIDTKPYYERREFLEECKQRLSGIESNVRILPVLAYCDTLSQLNNTAGELLDYVTGQGGEGIMINLGDASYQNKRTDGLLKYKDVKTIDMKVVNTYAGNGKYTGMVGGLACYAQRDDGTIITCDVGTGLSDAQRLAWNNEALIKGKIIEVAYFSVSQEKDMVGTKYYSLRFPRLIKVREDKNETSEY